MAPMFQTILQQRFKRFDTIGGSVRVLKVGSESS